MEQSCKKGICSFQDKKIGKKYLVHIRSPFSQLVMPKYKTFKGKKGKQTFKRQENRMQYK